MRKRIVVGINGSPASIDAMRTGKRFAEVLGANLSVVAAWDYETPSLDYVILDRDPEAEADRLLVAAGELIFGLEWPRGAQAKSVRGPAAAVLLDESQGALMLIVGAREHGRIARLLFGSVSGRCAEHAKCPVLVIHHQELVQTINADLERREIGEPPLRRTEIHMRAATALSWKLVHRKRKANDQ